MQMSPKYHPGDVVEFHHDFSPMHKTYHRVLILEFCGLTRHGESYLAWWLLDSDVDDSLEGKRTGFFFNYSCKGNYYLIASGADMALPLSP